MGKRVKDKVALLTGGAMGQGKASVRVNSVQPGTILTPNVESVIAGTPDPDATRERLADPRVVDRVAYARGAPIRHGTIGSLEQGLADAVVLGTVEHGRRAGEHHDDGRCAGDLDALGVAHVQDRIPRAAGAQRVELGL